jgi:3-oxoacyl-[acyl-carrier protein] reductase
MTDAKPLANRTALVTGAGNGIGRAEALALASLGAAVTVQDIRQEFAEETTDKIVSVGGQASTLVCDVADLDTMIEAINEIEQDGRGVDILVNNAGMGGGQVLEDVSRDHFDQMIAVNMRAPFFLAQAVVPGMKRRKWGRIINISSVVGVKGWPDNSHYVGTKAAVIGFSRAWALELATHGITANSVCPTMTATEMATNSMTPEELEGFAQTNPMKRLALPDDVANVVAFLCSPDSGFITGQTISPSGGSFVGAM